MNPGDWLAVMVKAADNKAWVYKRVNDGILQSPLSSGSTVSLTNGNWYTGKVVVGDDLGNSALQRLRFWIDTDDDGTWSDETALLDTTTVDDDWSAGHAGLFHGHIASTAAQDFDDVKIGFDNNADLDIDDGGDSIVINDDFASNATSLSYDDNGSLTDDGIFKFAYDAWNRLVAVKSRYTGGTTQITFATYAYDGANRRNSKVVTNNGVEVYPNDGGETTVHFYWDNRRRPLEMRNGSNQATWQYVWSGRSGKELIFADKNGDPTIGSDCDPDGSAGESSESPTDHRYFFHQNRHQMITALTDYGAGDNGNIVERYVVSTCCVLVAGSSGSEGSTVQLPSRVGWRPTFGRTQVPGLAAHNPKGIHFWRFKGGGSRATRPCFHFPADGQLCVCDVVCANTHIYGSTHCCEDGSVGCCVCDTNYIVFLISKGITSTDVIGTALSCVDAHEQSHVEDDAAFPCDDTPPGHPPPNAPNLECKARQAQLECLTAGPGDACRQSPDCRADWARLIEVVEKNCMNECLGYKRPPPLLDYSCFDLGDIARVAGGVDPIHSDDDVGPPLFDYDDWADSPTPTIIP